MTPLAAGSMPASPPIFYEAFGLAIRANGPLPGFREVAPRDVDLDIEWAERDVEGEPFEDEVLYATPGRTGAGAPYFTVGRPRGARDGQLRCRHSNDAGRGCFDLEPSGRRVLISAGPGVPKANLIAYLTGPVMGCVLRLRGFTCLHAAVVNINGRAIALVGPKGSGKSTLAAALAERGYPVVTDDIAKISVEGGSITIEPAYPRLRLWPESQQFVPGLAMDALPRVLTTMDKRYQPLTGDGSTAPWRFSTTSARLAAVYALGVSPESVAAVTALPRARGIMVLAANTYAQYLEDSSSRRRDFRVFGAVASRAPVCEATGPRGLDGFQQRCARIIEHAESLP
jgi:hypothetical protein